MRFRACAILYIDWIVQFDASVREEETNMYGLQKANILKRVTAFILDFILMTIAVTGFAFLLSAITGYQGHLDTFNSKYAYYEQTYGVDFDITKDKAEYEKLPKEEQERIESVHKLFEDDDDVIYAYNMMFNLILIISTFSILLAHLLLEFLVPMLLKNGQTIGKKVFAIGVVHINGVKIDGVALFSRSILGKYTIETMIPLIVAITMIFGGGGLVGLLVLGLILLLEVFVFFKEKNNTPIHDVISHTVVIDMTTQIIFNSVEELSAYKARLHAEAAAEADY